MLRFSFLLLLIVLSNISRAQPVTWEASCTPFSDGCLFLLATKEMHGIKDADVRVPLYKLAFHAGRMGYATIPGGDLDFAPQGLKDAAQQYLLLGRDIAEDRLMMSLDQPISGLKSVLAAPYILPRALKDLGQTEVQAILLASSLSSAEQGEILGRLFAMELNEGEYRFVNGQTEEYLEYLDSMEHPFLAISSLAITLAEEGYTREAEEIVERYLVPEDYHRAQDVLLYMQAIQAVFDGDPLRMVSLASAIQSHIFRLEALGHLYSLTRDQFVGKQYLSALYDFASPLTPVDRRNLVLFTLSAM